MYLGVWNSLIISRSIQYCDCGVASQPVEWDRPQSKGISFRQYSIIIIIIFIKQIPETVLQLACMTESISSNIALILQNDRHNLSPIHDFVSLASYPGLHVQL